MPISHRILSAVMASIPALLLGSCVILFMGDEYDRTTYYLVSAVFLVSSLVLGFALPKRLRAAGLRRAWIRLFVQGAIAWLIALVALTVLNLTPLCIGQDNGDGTNDLGMCVFYSVVAAAAYSPLDLVLLAASAAGGGLLLETRVRAGDVSVADDQTACN